MKEGNDQLDKIACILPSIEKIDLRGEVDYYGVSHLIAKKLKLSFVPRSSVGWKHGWIIADLKYKEQLTAGGNTSKFLMPLRSHEIFLKERGINAKAIGMPFVYVEDIETKKVERQPNSLLVMPPHSLPYTEHTWDEESYAKQINALRDDFDLIIVCLHASCVEKRLWVDVFEKYNIPWIIGADAQDKNSLIRMYRLFNSFEFMTTNVIGSHVVYAAYCGCKVSIFGDYAEYNSEDYKDDPFYNRFPFLLEYNIMYSSKKLIENLFPYLFSNPKEARVRIKWAEEELGKANKVSFEELRKLLGWNWQGQIAFFTRRIYLKAMNLLGIIKNSIENVIKY